jgi:hypothetical protein
MPNLPEDLRLALETGQLTLDQLRQLIALEAQALNLSVDEAVRLAQAGALPNHYIADDLAMLVAMHSAAAA